VILESILPLVGSYRDQVAIVTGASSGIGRETAVALAGRGASVALLARRAEQLEEVAGVVEAAGGRALVVPTDVGKCASVRAAVAKVRKKFGRVDLLVNNAGVLIPSTVADLEAADLEAMLRVNLFGALFMIQEVLPVMIRQGGGSIVNTASLAGRRGVSPLGGYCATKFALVGLTEALRTEPAAESVHIGLVLPGVVDTPMAQGTNGDLVGTLWPAALTMPPEWVVAAILLATRFRLREISVPPGAATLEILGALAPAVSDTLIRWSRAAQSLVFGTTAKEAPARPRRKRRGQ
jgi:NAD(P)-dependent dehydrogenase (short-subunit alcohol dehydrogenase family)